jgi:hypothetical protein
MAHVKTRCKLAVLDCSRAVTFVFWGPYGEPTGFVLARPAAMSERLGGGAVRQSPGRDGRPAGHRELTDHTGSLRPSGYTQPARFSGIGERTFQPEL